MGQNGSGGAATATLSAREEVAGLSHDDMRRMFETMLLARSLDERMWLMNRAGKAPFVVSCQGHEAAQAGMGFALDTSKDWLVPYYRDLALVLHFGMSARDIMLGFLARKGDPSSGGRQMPHHYGSRQRRILSISSPVATQIAQAPGVALATKMRGEDAVTVTCVGEGGTAEGDFHEGLNWASIHKLPVIFYVQNNNYAISVPAEKEMAVKNVADRAEAYGVPGVIVDGSDAIEVYLGAREAVARARRGEGPTLIEAKVHRMLPHSSDDDDRFYRSREEVESYRQFDPIVVTARRLRDLGAMSEEQEAEIRANVKASVDDATDFAEQTPYPDPSETFEHVYAPEGTRV